MSTRTHHPAIDERTTKMVVGAIAITLGPLVCLASQLAQPLTSISQSYFAGDVARNIFVGFLYAIGAFLLSYNGRAQPSLWATNMYMVAAKLAALAAVGVAMFPCACQPTGANLCLGWAEAHGSLHYACASVMFVVLAFFCWEFYQHAAQSPGAQAKLRARIYLFCLGAIVAAIAILGLNAALGLCLTQLCPRLVFWCELMGLEAFGVSWMVASHIWSCVASPSELHRPFALFQPNHPSA